MSDSDTTAGSGRDASQRTSDRQIGRDGVIESVATIFWNSNENRVRALWRALGAFLLTVVGAVMVLPGVLLSNFTLPPSVTGLTATVTTTVVVVIVMLIWARFVDRRPVADYGLDLNAKWLTGFGVGIGTAVIGWGTALVVDLAAGWATVSAMFVPGTGDDVLPFGIALSVFAANYLLVGIWEEIVFRGLIQTNAIEGLQNRWLSDRAALLGGVVVSSLLFGALHGSQATTMLALGYWVGVGVILGSAYALTDSLAVPIGLHFATNFAFNNVYGLSSVREGTAVLPKVIQPTFTGPEQFVGVSGLVNIGAVGCLGLLLVGYVFVRYGEFTARFSTTYSRGS
ncbi:CPBP family intramembrane glutamic endopeptidase [Halorubrum sp. BOL3-1]|uniref:CPBP family intramembrane glutamic endopeptidase n=1 Tax=Halorubrum sp. BOL3-1 TaxID=2497325 RepID=UPI00140834D8|nr:type II CAAX endopeptidase family protein [Halorubrum sp. BOL3-1]